LIFTQGENSGTPVANSVAFFHHYAVLAAMGSTTEDPFRLVGRTALITGAGGGIGRVLVEVFRSAGARVIGADREIGPLEELDLDGTLLFDLADGGASARAAADLIDAGRVPDILVNNAGFTRGETLAAVDEAVWGSEIDVNLTGPFRLTCPIAEAMAARGSGTIVFIASVNGLAYFGNPAYSAAKAGLIAYSGALAVELGARGVRSNVVCPGSVRTHAWDHRLAADPAVLGAVVRHYPLGRMVVPEEVARAALFLASPAASGITGAVLPVDAGLTSGNLRFVREVIEGRR
jgi:NAD(P)-dependent dehydrogenase (short-subunit alcohol dehydrogenase family)